MTIKYYLSIDGRIFWNGWGWTDIELDAKAWSDASSATLVARELQRQVGRYVTVEVCV